MVLRAEVKADDDGENGQELLAADDPNDDLYKLYTRLDDYMATLPLPTSWDAATELREAMTLGITDGTRPMSLTQRYQTAIMCKRAVKHGR